MVSSDIINERLKEIDENVGILEELKTVPAEEFGKDPKVYKLAERCLEISIQCALDICHHIIVENNWPRPKDNRQAILILAQKYVLPSRFANSIAPMAGLRNILTHEYLKIAPDVIYKHLGRLKDFRTFQKHIVKFLKKAK